MTDEAAYNSANHSSKLPASRVQKQIWYRFKNSLHYEFHVDPLDVCFGANQLFQPNIISSSQNGGEEEDNFDRAAHVAALCLRDFQ